LAARLGGMKRAGEGDAPVARPNEGRAATMRAQQAAWGTASAGWMAKGKVKIIAWRIKRGCVRVAHNVIHSLHSA
jgi:hypothetical protein